MLKKDEWRKFAAENKLRPHPHTSSETNATEKDVSHWKDFYVKKNDASKRKCRSDAVKKRSSNVRSK